MFSPRLGAQVKLMTDTSKVLPHPVIVVRGVVSHYAMHNDELLALWFAIAFGKKQFPGIQNAPLQLVDSGLRSHQGKTAQQWLELGYIFLGTGGGLFDEHDLPGETRATTSAATLMAEYLGIAEFGPVKAMLEHAVRVDRTATAAGFDASALAKAWHRNNVPTHQVRRMFDRAAEARFNVLSGRVRNANWKARPDLDRLASEWLVKLVKPTGYEGPASFATAYEAAVLLNVSGWDSFGPVLNYLQDGKNDPKDVFSLMGTINAMNMDGASLEAVREFALTSLDAKVIEQRRFIEGLDKLRALRKDGKLYINGTSLSIMHVRDDNPEINRSARNLDKNYDLFIQRRTDGHVVIWYNKKLNMDGAVARLRMGDRTVRKMPRLPWDRLTAEGTLPEAPWWYYNPAAGQVMCGSLTNKGTPVTRLDDNDIVRCIIRGLEAASVKK